MDTPAVPTTGHGILGRSHDVARLQALLSAGSRLVTLTGTAGVGKTRLATELARLTGSEGEIADLTEARGLEDLVVTVGGHLGLGAELASSVEAAIVSIGRALAARAERATHPALLVLDNAEHLVEVLRAPIARWLEAAPRARVLVTSREPLGADAETVYDVAPLALPEETGDPARSPAVALFLERLRDAGGDDPVAAGELDAVVAVVRRLEGIPLAIELAAAQRSASPGELLRALDSNRGRAAAAPTAGRHPTLHAAIEWSWDLLDSAERRALLECSVFRGGFTLADAAVVLAGAEGASPSDLVLRLRRRSMLFNQRRTDASDDPRFAIYASIFEFVSQRAGRDPEAETRHRDHFARAASGWRDASFGRGGQAALRRLILERHNLLAAAERALAGAPEPAALEGALASLAALDPVYYGRGPAGAWAELLDRALTIADGVLVHVDPAVLARAFYARAHMHSYADRFELARPDVERAKRDCQMASELAERAGDRGLSALALTVLGWLLGGQELRDEAAQTLRRAALAAHAGGDRRAEALALSGLARELNAAGSKHEALATARAGLDLAREVGDMASVARLELRVGAGLLEQGDEASIAHLDEALRLARELGLRRLEMFAAANHAMALHDARELQAAASAYGELLEPLRRDGFDYLVGSVSCHLGLACLALGEPSRAGKAFADADAVLDAIGHIRMGALARAGIAAVRADADDLEGAEAAFRQAEERLRDVGASDARNAIEVLRGHLDLALARAALAQGDVSRAARRRDAARARVTSARNRGDDGSSQAARSGAVRAALEALKTALLASDHLDESMVVATDGSWMQLPGAARIDVAGAAVRQRILAALVRRRIDAPGSILSPEDLVRAVWSGEGPVDDAAKNRLYVAIHALRQQGLRAVLLTRGEGWLLDPSVPLVGVEPG